MLDTQATTGVTLGSELTRPAMGRPRDTNALPVREQELEKQMKRREFLAAAGASALMAATARSWAAGIGAGPGDDAPAGIAIDLKKAIGGLPHVWERCAGSDRTVVGLRDQWRKDLVRAGRDCGILSVRCHGLFDDEMGIAASGGNYNYLYVDQVYDFMLDNGVRPFVELSFMPEAFASSANRMFFYKGNVSPPTNWRDWHDMVQAFTAHCVKRYGAAEVAQWQFEVWNEPNIGFWAGTKAEYFELYRQSVLAVKSVDKRIAVGGPATAMLAWIPDMIQFCAANNLPLDFVSTHIYPNDPQRGIFGKEHAFSYEQVMPKGIAQVKQQVESSAMPHLPLLITEWSSQNPAFMADTIRNCIGLTECMSYWTFSNVFEELGVPGTVFNNTFGLLDQYGIPRTSFHAMSLLRKLGEKRLQTGDSPVLATQRPDGSIAMLVWNLIPEAASGAFANGNPAASAAGASLAKGAPLVLNLQLNGLDGRKQIRVSEVNDHTGSAIPAWEAMGKPASPTREQIANLHRAATLPAATVSALKGSASETFSITLPPNGIALLELDA